MGCCGNLAGSCLRVTGRRYLGGLLGAFLVASLFVPNWFVAWYGLDALLLGLLAIVAVLSMFLFKKQSQYEMWLLCLVRWVFLGNSLGTLWEKTKTNDNIEMTKTNDNNEKKIGMAQQVGNNVFVYDENDHCLFTRHGKLQGYTSGTVTVKTGRSLCTFNAEGRLISTHCC